MKIVHVSRFGSGGGAAMCARRLNAALNKAGISSTVLSADSVSWVKKKWAFFNLLLEKFLFFWNEKNKSARFKFANPFLGIMLYNEKALLEADIIHLHWTSFGLVNYKFIRKISKLGKPVVWSLHDMNTFTGGCFYAQSCTNYQRECGDCIYLKNPGPKDLSHRIYKRKKKHDEKNIH